MKLSGQATVLFSIDPALGRLITQQFPAAQSAGSFYPLPGLSGQSGKVVVGETTLLAREQHPGQAMPGVDRRREYHILQKLSGRRLGPEVHGFADQWLLLDWQPGAALNEQQFIEQLEPLTAVVARLHRQPLSGHRLSLSRLLEQYWLRSRPERRHCGWLRALRRLQRQGEPRPLRLALLHMDIHAGNVISSPLPPADSESGDIVPWHSAASQYPQRLNQDDPDCDARSGRLNQGDPGHFAQAGGSVTPSLRLIDWEYASDGDVALELAAMVAVNGLNVQQQAQLTSVYATLQNLDPVALRRQMQRWQPWLRLLMAGWYELRWQQSQQEIFFTLAAQAWQRVLSD